ncbi:MAG: glycerol-3-phosphate 1-O-acyltransferase PlsY [Clostridia bacterium]|nr:glycerol-3-phosphate 1-O-acyltransferase PlsY [Clostridia bacterium]
MIWLISILTVIAAYLIGSVNTSIILSKALYGSDIRQTGSGNAGTTNMLRTHGKKMAAFTLIGDVLKGVVAVLLAMLADNQLADVPANGTLLASLPYIAGFFVVLGHNFPVFFQFRGGKGVATSLGVILTLDWKIGLTVLVIALAIMAISRYVSLGSVIAAFLFPVLHLASGLIGGDIDVMSVVFAAALAVLIIARHHSNISRLIRGTENKLGAKKE